MKTSLFPMLALLQMVVGPTATLGQTIDFESLPDGSTPSDDQGLPLGTPYTIGDVQVLLGFDTDGDLSSDDYGVFEAIGDDEFNGFYNALLDDRDVADPGFEPILGAWFFRSRVEFGGDDVPSLIVDYSTDVFAASGEIWDIETSTSGPERWRIRAWNSSGEVEADVLTPDLPYSGETGGFDGEPWVFNLDIPDGFRKITVEFVGYPTNGRGFAFNNFSATSTVPGPTLLTHQPDHVATDANGVSEGRLFWSEPIIISVTDVAVVTNDGSSLPVPFEVSGSGSQITTIVFTGLPGGLMGEPTPLVSGQYRITIHDSAHSAVTNAHIDGDGNGVAGGDASVVIRHTSVSDLDTDGDTDMNDFALFQRLFTGPLP